jgi:hypothetical protein
MLNKVSLIIVPLCFIAVTAFSNPKNNQQKDQKTIFDIESPVKISIKTNIDHIINNREIEPLPAKISVTTDDFSEEIHATVEVRGNFRRKKENCDFPPIRIRLNKEGEVEESIFGGNRSIKIVTHCKERSNQFLQFMAKEYTIYKIHNVITTFSFKVKMVEITYIDENDNLKPITRQAFMIEDVKYLAKRHHMYEFEGKLSADSIDHDNLLTTSVFQFMIGNTDWIIQFAKNLKFLRDKSKTVLVPYDFDYTALVGTNYTLDGGHTVLIYPERTFKGLCYETGELEAEFNRFRDKKDEIIELISKSSYLKSKSKTEMKNYINEFYSIIKSREKVKEYFLSKCN